MKIDTLLCFLLIYETTTLLRKKQYSKTYPSSKSPI